MGNVVKISHKIIRCISLFIFHIYIVFLCQFYPYKTSPKATDLFGHYPAFPLKYPPVVCLVCWALTAAAKPPYWVSLPTC